jgi:hypothetical protein
MLMAGCIESPGDGDRSEASKATSFFGLGAREHLVVGTSIRVRLSEAVSSETAKAGDAWHGIVEAPVVVDGDEIVATGSGVEGVVTGAVPARRGNRALLELEVREVNIRDRGTSLRATSDPVIAGSPRARNLGAIAGGAVAGALVGRALGGSGKAAAAGAVIGGGVAGGAVAASDGFQVVLPEGTVMTFTVSREVAMR